MITFFVSAASATVPAANDGQESDKKAVHIKQKEEVFVYQTEGRADPFMPFISERAATTEDPNEIIDEDIALTGMQLFEPGQLTLVALLSSGANKYAMVQDFTGRGYVIVEGTKIGRRGVVSSIIDNKVIIEETSKTRGGKVLKNQIAMVLKKEEGEE
ncbi:MAG: hypothetical protein CSA26_06935 [Desulfobacterales bacterium]|nr:MAG: hypothetical protein CSA26_06935 [Desulfobacterales bacterium]